MFLHAALAHANNDTTNFQRVTDCFAALGFIDHDLSKEVMASNRSPSKWRAQNLCQFPKHTRFAGRLAFVDQCSPSFKTFFFFVGQNDFQRFPLARKNNAWFKSVATLFTSACPVIESQILCHSGRSGFHWSDDFFYSYTKQFSAWCFGHLYSAGPTPAGELPVTSVRFYRSSSICPAVPVAFEKLFGCCSFLALFRSFVHFRHLLDQRCN